MKTKFILGLACIFSLSCQPSNTANQSTNKEQKETIMSTNSSQGTAITLKGNTIHTVGQLPSLNSQAPDFTLVANDLSAKSLKDFKGKYVILNIFPSLDTKTCATSVRSFNEKAAAMDNTVVLGISKDLPFASDRFCSAEGIENVITLSDFRSDFGHTYGVQLADGPLEGLLSRAIVVINPEGQVIYTEQVPEIVDEPNYEAALKAIQQ